MFQYVLRYHFVPSVDFEERFNDLVDFCQKAKMDEIMFFIAAEDLNPGHVTIEEAKAFIDVIQRAQTRLQGKKLTFSLNPWMTIGHYDGGKKLKGEQNFTTLVGHQGVEAELVSCPLCENWRNYYVELLNYYQERLNPTVIWLEDDFRLRGHRVKEVIKQGCFCKKHMQEYAKELGEEVTREELVNRVAEDLSARKAFLDVSRRTMEDTLSYFAKNVDKKVRFGLMTGEPSLEEGRRMGKLFEILGEGREKPFNRQTLCAFREVSNQTYAWNFNRFSLLVSALTGDTAYHLTEMENYPHNLRSKSLTFNRYQMLTSIPLCLRGATFSVFEFCGNGAIRYEGLAKVFNEVKPYMGAVNELGLAPCDMVGVRVLVSEDVAYSMKVDGSYFDNNADGSGFICSVLEWLGVACAYTTDTEINGKVVAVGGQTLRALTDRQIRNLFANNFVLLTADNVVALFDKGLQELIGATRYETLKLRESNCSLEEIEGDEKVCGVSRLRATCNFGIGDYCKIDYDGAITPLSRTFSHVEEEVGYGMVRTGNALVIPYFETKDIPYAYFNILREYCIKKGLFENPVCDKELFFIDEEGVCPYVFKKEGATVVECVNFGDDCYESLRLRSKNQFNKIFAITVENPTKRAVKFVREKDGYTVEQPLNGKESCVLILQ